MFVIIPFLFAFSFLGWGGYVGGIDGGSGSSQHHPSCPAIAQSPAIPEVSDPQNLI